MGRPRAPLGRPRGSRSTSSSPLLRDREVEIATWCSGVAAIAAGRRWSVVGDAGGRVEIDSVWIHLGPDQRPARIGDFGPYALSAAAVRTASTKLTLPGPPGDAPRRPWALRSTDLDVHGHVNNAVYWQAVEDWLGRAGGSLTRPHRAKLDYRDPIDLGDEVELAAFDGGDGRRCLAFVVGDRVTGGGRGRASLARGRLPLPLGAAVPARQRGDHGATHDSPVAGVAVELDPARMLVELDGERGRGRRQRHDLALDVVLPRIGADADAQPPLGDVARRRPRRARGPARPASCAPPCCRRSSPTAAARGAVRGGPAARSAPGLRLAEPTPRSTSAP